MLFEPFEEQFNAPPVFKEQRDGQRVRLKIVGSEDVLLAGFRVATDDFPYIFGIDLGAFINGKVPNGIRKQMIPATKTLYVSVTVALSHDAIELASVKKIG
jgi:hypothetical protein